MPNTKNITQKRFGKLTAIKLDHIEKNKYNRNIEYWLCKCDCGNYKIIRKNYLLNNDVKSCGCLKNIPKHTIHNKTNTRLFKIWQKMKERCFDTNSIVYNFYGKRGIKICDEWKKNFLTFYNWAMSNGYSDNLTIDRIDVNGNYEPENCKWSTPKEQARNRRSNKKITINNETYLLCEWLEKTNIPKTTYYRKIKRGLSYEEIFTLL